EKEGNYLKGKVSPQHKDKGEDKNPSEYRSDLRSPRIRSDLQSTQIENS
uniref:Uncharacterized protein n=1 Tax=Cucumis melo TaxID=3656 RepID=A0A9I9E1S4_CUCME